MALWLVRAGSHGEREDFAIQNKVAVIGWDDVSVFRLHEEFYSGVTNNELLYERTIKEIYHELGHNFGLIHCQDWDCVMHSSNSIEEVDLKGDTYCKKCFSSLSLP